MKKFIIFSLLMVALTSLLLTGCQAPADNSNELETDPITQPDEVEKNIPTQEEFSIEPQLVDCIGVGPTKCMKVNGNYFYNKIEGFEYVEGYSYKLIVEKATREEPIPADASKFTYTLVEVVSKEAVIPADCKVWFDGCNNCMMNENGQGACTRKFCLEEAMEEPKCLEYETVEEAPVACCMAMTASCLACSQGVDVETYCASNPETAGC